MAAPAPAVRPRVLRQGVAGASLLDASALGLERASKGWIACLLGLPGWGKSTAIDYVRGSMPSGVSLTILDDPPIKAVAAAAARGPVLYASTRTLELEHVCILRLAPWTPDDLIEYALARHRAASAVILPTALAAMQRDSLGGAPWVWARVLDHLASRTGQATGGSQDSISLAVAAAHDGCPNDRSRKALVARAVRVEGFGKAGRSTGTSAPQPLCSWVESHQPVRLALAAASVAEQLSRSDLSPLKGKVRPDWLRALAHALADPAAQAALRDAAATAHEDNHAWCASLLLHLDPAWRPPPGLTLMHHAKLPGVRWSGVDLGHCSLFDAHMPDADLRSASLAYAFMDHAELPGARLDNARISHASLIRAELRGASLVRALAAGTVFVAAHLAQADLSEICATGASFDSADLSDARLVGANLQDASLVNATVRDADLTRARLGGAQLTQLDLRTARLAGARFDGARLINCDLQEQEVDGIDFSLARLAGCDLSGTRFHGASLADARIERCGLAYVDWEGADLRGALLSDCSFHAGSSRSGLVFSPIASEGTRTGFYTDDSASLSFQEPEAIRKASLRGADLRGASFKNVDFYLVDLRDVRIDDADLAMVRRHGAIL